MRIDGAWGMLTRFSRALSSVNDYLGHGRALESALIFVKLQYWIMIAFAPWRPFIVAFNDVVLPRWVLALPFLIAGMTSLAGLILNARGHGCSRHFRIIGAMVGMAIWIYILTKNILVGLPAAGVNPWCVMGILGSIWIIRRGALGLPPPGVSGVS